jgi:signal transduction histidine kinase
LGHHAAVFNLTDDGAHLVLVHHNYESAFMQAVEKLTGLPALGYRIPLTPGGLFQRMIASGQPVFDESAARGIVDALPRQMHPLAGQLADMLGVGQAICVPLEAGGETVGLMAIIGEDLAETDVPAIAAFANQASIALENVQLLDTVRTGRERLQALSRRLVEVQESERRHLARELHDEIGQTLTGLKLVLQMGERQVGEAHRKARLERAQALIDELATRVEDLSLDLRPSILDDLGLLPALLWHMERFEAQTGVQVRLKHSGVEGRRFPQEVETAVYRLVQESLTNVVRHAGVSEALVRVWAHQDLLSAQIEDAGRGFDVTAALAAGHSTGLTSMRERVALLHGDLTIESAPDAGTRLTVGLPLGAETGQRNRETES